MLDSQNYKVWDRTTRNPSNAPLHSDSKKICPAVYVGLGEESQKEDAGLLTQHGTGHRGSVQSNSPSTEMEQICLKPRSSIWQTKDSRGYLECLKQTLTKDLEDINNIYSVELQRRILLETGNWRNLMRILGRQ